MRRLFFMFAAAIGLLASCSSDDIATGQDGEKSVVTITATLPAGFATRANISDGTTANKLSYAVYKKGSKTAIFSGKRAVQFTNREATLPLTLAIGESYDFVFWADADDAPYKFDEKAQTITVTYNGKSNDEKRDAFFGQIKNFKVTERATSLSATLYRPFSQINVATDDYDAAATAGVTVTTSSFTVTGGVYNTLNLLDGSVTGEETNGVTFTDNAIPTEKIAIDGKQYTWLTMNYMLVDQAKALTTVTGTFNNAATPVLSLTSVPIQRNYRTNIYGSLLTSAATAKILIDQNFQRPEYNVSLTWDGQTKLAPTVDANNANLFHITSAAQLAGLADAVKGGETYEGKTITLDADMNLAGQEFAPIGLATSSGKTYNGGTSFKGTFDGQGHTISGLSISNSTNEKDCIGLFGVVDGGTVKDVKLAAVNINVPNNSRTGVAVGLLVGGGTVSGVEVTGSITAKSAGGVVGRVTVEGTVTKCKNSATVTGSATNVGGICAAAYYTEAGKTMIISDCENHGVITGQGYTGGIVGLSAAETTGCKNTAKVTGTGNGTSQASLGGIVGEQRFAGSVKNCENTGDVVNTSTQGYGNGGIVGWVRYPYDGNNGAYGKVEVIEVSGNTNRGDIIGSLDAGGIVGTAYHQANVTGNKNYASTIKAITFAAGIVGNAQFTGLPDPGITGTNNVVVTGNVSTTPAASITAQCTDLYVYDNSNGTSVTKNDNTQN